MKNINVGLVLLGLLSFSLLVSAHNFTAQAKYLGNEAVLVTAIDGEQTIKVLFDPFFHKDYSTYTLVPNEIRKSIFAGEKPYNNINAIFVSHAQKTNLAFVPYWFYLSKEGNDILDNYINAKSSSGVHVPTKIPVQLIKTKKNILSKPGEVRDIN